MRKLKIIALAVFLQMQFGADDVFAQVPQAENITRQETLRGSVTPEREWWDLLHYHLKVEFLPERRRLSGSNTITFRTLKSGNKMQIDLQPPLAITKINHRDSQLKFERAGNVYWVMFEKEIPQGIEDKIEVFYEGVPVEARRPPWVGGITWGKDDLGEHFIVTTAQGIGASIWWPNKDHGSDEPDRGMQISVTVPDNLVGVSNGRLKKTDHDVADKKKTFHWEVLNPINNYGVNVNIGNYVNFSEKYKGKGGVLDLDYWVLAHQKDAAMKWFKEVPRTIEAFEHKGFDGAGNFLEPLHRGVFLMGQHPVVEIQHAALTFVLLRKVYVVADIDVHAVVIDRIQDFPVKCLFLSGDVVVRLFQPTVSDSR